EGVVARPEVERREIEGWCHPAKYSGSSDSVFLSLSGTGDSPSLGYGRERIKEVTRDLSRNRCSASGDRERKPSAGVRRDRPMSTARGESLPNRRCVSRWSLERCNGAELRRPNVV